MLLFQSKYLENLLTKFHMHIFKSVCALVTSRAMLSLIDEELLLDPTEQRSMVGILKYLSMTRPDISYAVNLISQFMYTPRTTHLFVVQCTFFDICRV